MITFIAASSNAATGNVTVVPPPTQPNDVMVCAIATGPVGLKAVLFPLGWTVYETTGGIALRATLAWKRCVGVEAPFVITSSNSGIVASVAVYRGCRVLGSPVNMSIFTPNAPSAICRAASIIPSVPNCRVLFTTHSAGAVLVSDQFSSNFGGMESRFANSSVVGADETVAGSDFLATTAMATGDSTATLSLARVNVGGHTVLEPEP